MNDPAIPFTMNSLRGMLGFRRSVPLTLAEMAKGLKVVFVPWTRETPRLSEFGKRFREGLTGLGVKVVSLPEALNSSGLLQEGVVPVHLGESSVDLLSQGELPLLSLYSNPSVGIFDRPNPAGGGDTLSKRLQASVNVMADHLVTLCLYVTDDTWTMSTMNGAIVTYRNGEDLSDDLLRGFVPKVAARVVPPRIADLATSFGTFETTDPDFGGIAGDFAAAARIWAEDGSMSAHVAVDSLTFRSAKHRALVGSYLDERNGMSYGFLSWQLPQPIEGALSLGEAGAVFGEVDWDHAGMLPHGDRRFARIKVGQTDFVCAIPPVSVICTRSGCRKDRIDPSTDLVRMTLREGKVLLETAPGVGAAEGCRPSYDTYTILGNALGNVLAASVLKRLRAGSDFVEAVETRGLSLTHWHGYLNESGVPEGYVRHGADNPGVCCATLQSAIYSLSGKIEALAASLSLGTGFRGDIHIEPHHGTNLCGLMSLGEAAAFAVASSGGAATVR